MTISSEDRIAGPYTADGVNRTFQFDFKVFNTSEVQVLQKDLSDVETTVASGYTVSLNSDQNSDPGGDVVFTTAPTSGYLITVTSDVANTQETNLTNGGGFYPTVINDALDKLTILVQQLLRDVGRSIKFPISDGELTTELPTATSRGDTVILFDTDGALNVSVDLGATAIQVAADAASAAASAAAASAAVSSALWRDVVFITSASSPYTINSTHNGKLIAVDTSGGNVTINLPSIASIAMPFTIGVKKTTGDGNTVTINRNGTDVIDNGLTSRVLATLDSGVTFVADTDPSPDKWVAATFGSIGGDITIDTFSGTGAQTAFTLSTSPGSKNNTQVYISGVYQPKSTYSIAGTTITFVTAPSSGTSNIEVASGTQIAIGVPGDDTVATVKIQNSAVTTAKIADLNVTTAKIADANVSYAKLLTADIATGSDVSSGTASKIASAASVKAGVDTLRGHILHVQNQQASGTNGGTFTSGAWQTRVLNTVLTNLITGASLASNQITLPSGTYRIIAFGATNACDRHQMRWQNTSDGTTTITGLSSVSSGTLYSSGLADVVGVFTISSSKIFELQHRCQSTRATEGFGLPGSWGTEVYADVFIEKIG